MAHKLLIINPGSTSTKLAIYEDGTKLVQENIEHDAEELKKYENIADQVPYRRGIIDEFLKRNGTSPEDLSAVVGRGGLVKGLHPGGYIVNQDLYTALGDERYCSPHASALGGLLAKPIADDQGIPAYIYDAVTGGDLDPVFELTGMPELKRKGESHLLNSHAMAIKYAEEHGKKYEDMNFIIAHMGGGTSVSAHGGGRFIDCIGDDEGHMSPERAGTFSSLDFMDLCYSGKFTKAEMKKKLRGEGGMAAYLGTSDCRKIEEMIENGDEKAKLVYEAEALHISKDIGQMAVSHKGKVDVIILTGGVAHSKMLTDMIKGYVEFIAPVAVMAGESEMDALALGGLRLLTGEESPQTYTLPVK